MDRRLDSREIHDRIIRALQNEFPTLEIYEDGMFTDESGARLQIPTDLPGGGDYVLVEVFYQAATGPWSTRRFEEG
jgi:hypothetical protein